jgi:hypothetical protein
VSGANRDRTGDLLVANQALSQLSYGPEVFYLNNLGPQSPVLHTLLCMFRCMFALHRVFTQDALRPGGS